MNNEIIYESEINQMVLIEIWIGIFAFSLLLIGCEYWLWIPDQHIGNQGNFILVNLLCLSVFGYPLIDLIRYAIASKPMLQVCANYMFIGDDKILFADIENIDSNAQKRLWFWGKEELVIIKLKNRETYNLPIGYYRNGPLFRSVCATIQVNIDQGRHEVRDFIPKDVVVNSIRFQNLKQENFKRYLWSPIMCLLMALLLFGAYTELSGRISGSTERYNFIFAGLTLGGFFYMGRYQKYILVSPNYVVVGNYFYFWQKTIFPMKEIIRFQINWRSRVTRALEIMTSDHKLHEFVTASSFGEGDAVDAVNELMQKKREGK